jgi:transcription elongation factor Elf1
MAEKQRQLIFRCVHCGEKTTIIVNLSRQMATQSKKISVVQYCEHCNRANKLEVPDNVDVHVFILGRDKGFLGSSEGIPILQGEKDL